MKISINYKEKLLNFDDAQYRFTAIHMSKKSPVWLVELADGGLMRVKFEKEEVND